MTRLSVIAGAVLFATAACAQVRYEEPGAPDVAQGRALVQHYCVGCHSVQPDGLSPVAAAPPFRWFKTLQPDVLQSVALHIGRGDHASMPQIILSQGESRAVAAFIRAYANADPKTQKAMSLARCTGGIC